MKTRILLAVPSLCALGGCATTFHGSPMVEGRRQCEDVCAGWKMELAGMVQMGDYSSGCICEVPGKMIPPHSAAAAGEAGVAVMIEQEEAYDKRMKLILAPLSR